MKAVFKRIVEGVAYLHSRDVAHRDIKLNNIVLDSLESPKIIDFGFARRGVNSNFESGCGTVNYMAPELLSNLNNKKKAGKADIWALGVILYYLITRRYPFRATNENVLFNKVKNEAANTACVEDKKARFLLEQMLAKQQDARPTCQQVLESDYFTQVEESQAVFELKKD